MSRRLIVVFCLVLVACGSPSGTATPAGSQPTEPPPTELTEAPTEAPATEVTEAPTEAPATEAATEAPGEAAVPWDNPYDPAVYFDPATSTLCPEDGEPDGQPVFGPVTDGQLDNQAVLIRHGLYANQENEVFRIDVMGVNAQALEAYTNQLSVCLDHILSNTITKPAGEPAAPGEVAEPFGSHPEDISTEVYTLAFADKSLPRDEVRGMLEKIVDETDTTVWPELLKELNLLTPQDADPDNYLNDFFIAYIIDPPIANGARHQYPEKTVSSVYVTTSVRDGAGSVTSGICRDYILLTSTIVTVTHEGTHTLSSSNQKGFNGVYDLGVRGLSAAGSRYRISGVWWMPGWSAGYFASAPTGSLRSCNP